MDIFKKIFNGSSGESKEAKKVRLTSLQNIVMNVNFPILRFSEYQIHSATIQYINNHTRIINDCVELVNETKTPKVFFERYKTLLQLTKELAIIEPLFQNFKDPKPSQQYRNLLEHSDEFIRDFIDRYYKSAKAKIESLKTQKARQKTAASFYEILMGYSDLISDANQERISELTGNLESIATSI